MKKKIIKGELISARAIQFVALNDTANRMWKVKLKTRFLKREIQFKAKVPAEVFLPDFIHKNVMLERHSK